MNERREEEKQVKRFCTKMILFSALTDDFIFFVMIDTLFLAIVKKLSVSQITLLSALATTIGILIQPGILKIIQQKGNTISIRIGAFCFCLASLLLTIGNHFAILVLGEVFYEIGFIFKNMENVCLKNNLKKANQEGEYVRIKNKITTSYAVITMVTAVTSGILFNINHYLPMILNCVVYFGCFFLSLTIKDETKYDKIMPNQRQKSKDVKQKSSFAIYIAFLTYAFFFSAVSSGQTHSKLLIQAQLENAFELSIATIYFSSIIFISRLVRISGNLLFNRVYRKWKEKIGERLAIFLMVAFGVIIFGYFMVENELVKIGMMASGFFIILGVRDPFNLYIQDLVLKITVPEVQQEVFSNLALVKKVGQALVGFLASAMLVKVDVIWVIWGVSVISWMAFRATIRLEEVVKRDFEETKKRNGTQGWRKQTVEKIITLEKSHKMRKEGEMIK